MVKECLRFDPSKRRSLSPLISAHLILHDPSTIYGSLQYDPSTSKTGPRTHVPHKPVVAPMIVSAHHPFFRTSHVFRAPVAPFPRQEHGVDTTGCRGLGLRIRKDRSTGLEAKKNAKTPWCGQILGSCDGWTLGPWPQQNETLGLLGHGSGPFLSITPKSTKFEGHSLRLSDGCKYVNSFRRQRRLAVAAFQFSAVLRSFQALRSALTCTRRRGTGSSIAPPNGVRTGTGNTTCRKEAASKWTSKDTPVASNYAHLMPFGSFGRFIGFFPR